MIDEYYIHIEYPICIYVHSYMYCFIIHHPHYVYHRVTALYWTRSINRYKGYVCISISTLTSGDIMVSHNFCRWKKNKQEKGREKKISWPRQCMHETHTSPMQNDERTNILLTQKGIEKTLKTNRNGIDRLLQRLHLNSCPRLIEPNLLLNRSWISRERRRLPPGLVRPTSSSTPSLPPA